MTSRELVIRIIEFDSPARVPRNLWILPWALNHHENAVRQIQEDFPEDITGAPAAYPLLVPDVRDAYGVHGQAYQVGSFTDEWECAFEIREPGIWGQVRQPLIADWGQVDRVRIPDEYLRLDAETVNAFCAETDKFVVAGLAFGEVPRPFERLQFLRSTQNLYMDLMERPPEFLALLDQIHQFYIKVLDQWAKTAVDALLVIDDWGSQRSLLVSPAIWRELFRPLYKEYADIAHHYNKYLFFHSDGYITDILPELIDLGVDAINCQVFCMGVEELGKRFAGQITFWGEVDRQHILPEGTPEEVVRAVTLVKDNLYREGGAIAQCEFGAGARPENVRLVFETWDQLCKET